MDPMQRAAHPNPEQPMAWEGTRLDHGAGRNPEGDCVSHFPECFSLPKRGVCKDSGLMRDTVLRAVRADSLALPRTLAEDTQGAAGFPRQQEDALEQSACGRVLWFPVSPRATCPGLVGNIRAGYLVGG